MDQATDEEDNIQEQQPFVNVRGDSHLYLLLLK